MRFRFCDDLGPDGFGWIVDEAMTRTSHALAADGKVWLVDALDWPEAIDRALELGEPAGVVQLLDRHDRDCAALASQTRRAARRRPGRDPREPVRLRPGHAAEALARVGALVAATRGRSSWRTRSARTASTPAGRRRSAYTCSCGSRRRGRSPRSSRSASSSATARDPRPRRDGRAPRGPANEPPRLPGVLLRLPFAGRR